MMTNQTNYPLYHIATHISDLKDMLKQKENHQPDDAAICYSDGAEQIITKTFAQLAADVDALGTVFFQQGISDNTHVALIGANSYEWLVAFFAVTNGGNVAVPMDRALSPKELRGVIQQAECRVAICDDAYAEMLRSDSDLTVIAFSQLAELCEKGRQLMADGYTGYQDYVIQPQKLAAIFFTSGTTGTSKGVMLSHQNMAANINAASQNFRLDGATLAVLPFHHTFGLITAVFKVLNYGKSVFINASLRTLPANLQLVQPQTMFVVPLFLEKFYRQIIGTAKKMQIPELHVAKKILGMNLQYVICGGAPLHPMYVRAFREWGIAILNGYGITECSPVVAVNRNEYNRDGSVGQIVPDCAVKIAEDGEIFVKSDFVMLGYYNDPESTDLAIQDGWYATNDLGYVDADGFLFITGRKKNLIILSNGENVSPESIEMELLENITIEEVVVYAEQAMIVAEIYPAKEYMADTSYFHSLIERYNFSKPSARKIRKFKLRETEFEKNTYNKILRAKYNQM